MAVTAQASVSTGYSELDALLPRLDALASLSAETLEAEEIAVLGRKAGVLTAALKRVASLSIEERKRYGAAVNQLKQRFEAAFAARREVLESERKRRDQAGIDLTMPARTRWVGAEHPVTRVVDEIVDIFREIGFTVATGPRSRDRVVQLPRAQLPGRSPGDGHARHALPRRSARRGRAVRAGCCSGPTPRRCRSARCSPRRRRCAS